MIKFLNGYDLGCIPRQVQSPQHFEVVTLAIDVQIGDRLSCVSCSIQNFTQSCCDYFSGLLADTGTAYYVDAGAYDPVCLSNTLLLRSMGWSCLHQIG